MARTTLVRRFYKNGGGVAFIHTIDTAPDLRIFDPRTEQPAFAPEPRVWTGMGAGSGITRVQNTAVSRTLDRGERLTARIVVFEQSEYRGRCVGLQVWPTMVS
ncbi:MAG: hypothetical protein PVF07_12810 [Thiogranum sp.]|jgi:hypothetical protein